jgi:peptidoglycan/LPS O-acetylase OafA/YrhL
MIIAVHAIDEGRAPSAGVNGITVLALSHAVQLFFGISGFLLFRPYVAALAAGRSGPRLRSYAQRRALRILPGYWIGLTLLALVLPAYVPGVFSSHWWQVYGFGQVYSKSTDSLGISAAWTLCVEVTFYLLLPVIASLCRSLSRLLSWRAAAWVPVVVMLVTGFSIRYLEAAQLMTWRFSLTLLGMCHFLALGMGLAILSVADSETGRRSRPLSFLERKPLLTLALAVLAGVAGGYLLLPGVQQPLTDGGRIQALDGAVFALSDLAVCAAVGLLMIPALFADARRDPVRRVMGWAPLRFVGVISYGAYIWHWPLIAWLAGPANQMPYSPVFRFTSSTLLHSTKLTLFVTAVPVSLAVGALSYYVIELPFLRFKSGWRRAKHPQVSARPPAEAVEESAGGMRQVSVTSQP